MPLKSNEKMKKLRPYISVANIGKGSFATVYKGYHEVRLPPFVSSRLEVTISTQETHQQVAIKTVKRDVLHTAKLFDNLQSEIDILKSLSHRHITKLIDIIVRLISLFYTLDTHLRCLIPASRAEYLLDHGILRRRRPHKLYQKERPCRRARVHPLPGAAIQYYPHPRSGGLDEIVVRSFLRQLGELN